MTCDTTPAAMVEERIDRVLTQYRESPRLLGVLRSYLRATSTMALQMCELPNFFDIDTAVGDQLTLLGKRLGWPRCHCACDVSPVFGFACEDETALRPVTGFGYTGPIYQFGFACEGGPEVAGFCEDRPSSWGVCPEPDRSQASPNSTWAECASGLSEMCLSDDEVYRRFLKVRVYQFTGRFDLASLEECLRIFWGDEARALYAGQGRIVVAPGRDLSDQEIQLLQLYPRVLPIALGVTVRFHFGEKRVFGFGEGWGGFMEPDLVTTQETEAWLKTGKIFGFCDDAGGFCEDWLPEGAQLGTEAGDDIVDEMDNDIYTGPMTEDAAWMCRVGAPWMCEIDVNPYDCGAN